MWYNKKIHILSLSLVPDTELQKSLNFLSERSVFCYSYISTIPDVVLTKQFVEGPLDRLGMRAGCQKKQTHD